MNNQINVEKIQPTGIFTNYIFKAIPLAFDESMSYYECLCGLLDYLKNTVIPAVNNNGDAVIELQEKFAELKSFVDNYFDNLDVQDEINNKIDAMVLDGTMDALLNTNLTGSLSDLNTTDNTNLVSAINEVNTEAGNNTTNIGDLSNLETTEKSNLVGAINEVITELGDINEYSANETEIGTWNGVALYRKTFHTSLEPDQYDMVVIPHLISNLGTITNIKCIADMGDGNYFNFDNYIWYDASQGESSFNSACHVFVDDTNIIVSYTGTHNLGFITDADITIEYTKALI